MKRRAQTSAAEGIKNSHSRTTSPLPPSLPHLHLVEHALRLLRRRHAGRGKHEAPDGGLHVQLLENGRHVAGGPAVVQPRKRPAQRSSMHSRVAQRAQQGLSCMWVSGTGAVLGVGRPGRGPGCGVCTCVPPKHDAAERSMAQHSTRTPAGAGG